MKKMFLFAVCTATLAATLLLACKKSSDTARASNTCTDSAFLLPDSFIACSPSVASNYKMFYVRAKNKDILVAKGTFTDIDTLVNGGNYLINFDSIGTLPMCGTVVTKANLTCHTRL